MNLKKKKKLKFQMRGYPGVPIYHIKADAGCQVLQHFLGSVTESSWLAYPTYNSPAQGLGLGFLLSLGNCSLFCFPGILASGSPISLGPSSHTAHFSLPAVSHFTLDFSRRLCLCLSSYLQYLHPCNKLLLHHSEQSHVLISFFFFIHR